MNQEFFGTQLDFAVQELAQQLDGEIFLRHPANLGQKVVGQNRNVGLLQTGGGKNVHDFIGCNGTGNNLPDGGINVPRRFILAADFILGDGGADGLEKSNVIADLNRLGVRNRQRKRLGKLGDGAQKCLFVVVGLFGLGPLRVNKFLRRREQAEFFSGFALRPF